MWALMWGGRGGGEMLRRGWFSLPPAMPCGSGEGVSIYMKQLQPEDQAGCCHPLVLDCCSRMGVLAENFG